MIGAPAELTARLAFTGLVDRADGSRLQAGLPVGGRLVSREGDLWRWDGFVSRAEAPRPAAIRLEQRRRLAELETSIEIQTPQAAAASHAHGQAIKALQDADEALRTARKGPEAAERALGAMREDVERHGRESARREAQAQSLDETIARFETERAEAEEIAAEALAQEQAVETDEAAAAQLAKARSVAATAREAAAKARATLDIETRERGGLTGRLESLRRDRADWARRAEAAAKRGQTLVQDEAKARASLDQARSTPDEIAARRTKLLDELAVARARGAKAADALDAAETARVGADRAVRAADAAAAETRERRAAAVARLDGARERLAEVAGALRETTRLEPEALGQRLRDDAVAAPSDADGVERHLADLERERDAIGPVNLRAEEEAADYAQRLQTMRTERADLAGAVARLRQGIEELNGEGRERLLAAFDVINEHFQALFQTLFGGGQAELRLIESDDPLEAGLEIYACPPGKRLSAMSLMSGGEQALTAAALIFGVFLANPAPICVLDEVDAPLDDANVDRFCHMLHEMRTRTQTRFIVITHNPVTMARMDRLYGVTMPERGVSQLVSVDLRQAEALAAQ
jgi:chromosome segregation protein